MALGTLQLFLPIQATEFEDSIPSAWRGGWQNCLVCGTLSLMLYVSEHLSPIMKLQSGCSYPRFTAGETEELRY